MQIIVLGMHRSGTSLAAGLFHLMGAYVGADADLLPARSDNPKGFWERQDVIDVNEDVLKQCNCRWYRPARFDMNCITARIKEQFNDGASAILQELDANKPWVLKDPRLCLLYPLWEPLLTDPYCVCVCRHPADVALSLERRNGFPHQAGLALWEAYTVSMLNATREASRAFVNFDELSVNPVETAQKLYACIGGSNTTMTMPDEEAIIRFVHKNVNGNGAAGSKKDHLLSVPQRDLWETINSGSPERLRKRFYTSPIAFEIMLGFERLDYATMPLKKKWRMFRTQMRRLLPLPGNRRAR